VIAITNVIVALAFIGLDSWYTGATIHEVIEELFTPEGLPMEVNGKCRLICSNRLRNYTYQVLRQMVRRKIPLIERKFELGKWHYCLTDEGRKKVEKIKFLPIKRIQFYS